MHLVVYIEPLRMMVNLVRLQRNSGHKSKSLVEVFEHKFFVDGIPVFDHCPS